MKNQSSPHVRIIGFAAFSGTGKTTLLKQLIPLLTHAGVRLAIVKHSHHDFEIDHPGKDSYELHHAGSSQTLITSKYRSALIRENSSHSEPKLEQELQKLDLTQIDLVLVEGFRHEQSLYRIELHRPSLNKPLLYPGDDRIIALASDQALDTPLPLLDINDPAQLAEFILQWMQKN
ncbi:MAG: molybdopterin-guanine dinucleotide biosynthesis protein B [Gammaproteobacteria bacterium]|nr:molybdopterin-guanine dinucleotide biosynthesis protein B [Gammaproteobacteria bacterium]